MTAVRLQASTREEGKHRMIGRVNPINGSRTARTYPYAYILILTLALVIRLIGLDKGIWLDEYHSLSYPFKEDFLQTVLELRNNDWPPLYFLIINLWSKISTSEPFLRLPSIIFTCGTILAVMRWMKKYSELAGILAGLYLATTPIMILYSQEIRGYALLVLATALAFFFGSRLASTPENAKGYIGVSLSLTLAILTHLVGIMLMFPLCIFILMKIDFKRIHWGKSLAAAAFPLAVYSFLYFFFLESAQKGDDWWIPPISLRKLLIIMNTISGFSWMNWPSILEPVIILFLIASFCFVLIHGNWRLSLPFLLAGVVYWMEMIAFSVFRTPILMDRTLLPSLVPLSGFAALQIATISKRGIKTTLVVAFVLLNLFLAVRWAMTDAGKPREALKEISRFVQSRWKPGDLAIMYPGYMDGSVRFYFSGLPPEAEIKIDIKSEMSRVQSDFDIAIAKRTARLPFTVYLIARIPKELREGHREPLNKYQEQWVEKYRMSVETLELRCDQPSSLHEFGGILIVRTCEFRGQD